MTTAWSMSRPYASRIGLSQIRSLSALPSFVVLHGLEAATLGALGLPCHSIAHFPHKVASAEELGSCK